MPATPRLARRAFARWESSIDAAIRWYVRQLNRALNHRLLVVLAAVGLLVAAARRSWALGCGASFSRRSTRAPSRFTLGPQSGTRIEETEKMIARVEQFVRDQLGEDVQLIISELGVVADLSAAYTPNAGPMDAVVKVQLKHEREHSAQEYVHKLRDGVRGRPQFPRPGVCL